MLFVNVELIMKRDSDIASLFRKHKAKKITSPWVVDDEDSGLLLTCVDPAPLVQFDSEDVRRKWKMQHQIHHRPNSNMILTSFQMIRG